MPVRLCRNLSDSSGIAKAFQNPECPPIKALAKLGTKEARERLKEIEMLTRISTKGTSLRESPYV